MQKIKKEIKLEIFRYERQIMGSKAKEMWNLKLVFLRNIAKKGNKSFVEN